MAAVCLSILHMDDSWSHYLLEQTLHHYCQVGRFQFGVGACYSGSPFLCQTATTCHYCILIHLPAEILWGQQITITVTVWLYIIIIINMVNTPRRVQRYGYNRNYNTTADTIASSSMWLK